MLSRRIAVKLAGSASVDLDRLIAFNRDSVEFVIFDQNAGVLRVLARQFDHPDAREKSAGCASVAASGTMRGLPNSGAEAPRERGRLSVRQP